MKSFYKETNISEADRSLDIASLLMEVVPAVMSYIRAEMRIRRMPGLSVPYFRALIFVYRHQDASLSQVAEHLGLKLPSTSKIVDALTARKLMVRRHSQEDRRLIRLRLSSTGFNELMRTRQSVETCLADILNALAPPQKVQVIASLKTLKPLFTGGKRTHRQRTIKNNA
jgi:MarR family transcriptional regulator for hemolysin